MALLWLSNEAWAAIEPHVPRNQSGARRVILGIVHARRLAVIMHAMLRDGTLFEALKEVSSLRQR